jgi:hypothetical protein
LQKRQNIYYLAVLLAVSFLLPGPHLHAQVIHEVFLPNTDHELNVYRIFGEEPGRTLMIIGGIQGDEPGSYLTADLYADIHLKKGNLIVVPRANFYSILLNRREGLTGDMNRKFGNNGNIKKNLEEEVVVVLKHLIAESDCLLNLHEGSGYYSPTWISEIENPRRFGQSIIYDAEFYQPADDKTIRLGDLARKVTLKANQQIDNPRHHFRPNNHDTLSGSTDYPEQRLSATYYALTEAHIPAFGVETSKMIKSLETKISYHKLIINSFMEEFGIILDTPGLNLAEPQLDYLLIKVNKNNSFAMPHGAKLTVQPGDEIIVTGIIANYKRGLVVDVEGYGNRNDTNIPFKISKPTTIMARKDSKAFGWVDLVFDESTVPVVTQTEETDPEKLLAKNLVIHVDNSVETLAAGSTLTVTKGSLLVLKGIESNIPQLDNEIFINFKGFAPPKAVNDGNDLDFPIYTNQDLWPRYSENKQGKRYPVVATYNNKTIGKFWIELADK